MLLVTDKELLEWYISKKICLSIIRYETGSYYESSCCSISYDNCSIRGPMGKIGSNIGMYGDATAFTKFNEKSLGDILEK